MARIPTERSELYFSGIQEIKHGLETTVPSQEWRLISNSLAYVAAAVSRMMATFPILGESLSGLRQSKP